LKCPPGSGRIECRRLPDRGPGANKHAAEGEISAQQAILGFFTPWIVYAGVTLLHVGLPAIPRKGCVRSERTGKLLTYKLNGNLVLPGCALAWLVLGYIRLVPWTWLHDVRWPGLAGAAALGALFSLAAVLPHPAGGKSALADLWHGRLKDPQFKRGSVLIDAKIWLRMAGAVMLQLNVLSFLARHWPGLDTQALAGVNPGFLAAAAMLTFFIWDYFTFEKTHLYTRGFTSERVGFKLGFGCLAFLPYFYPAALWATAGLPDPGRPAWLTAFYALVFLSGWALSRGAGLQKYYFKTDPAKRFLGIRPRAISDDKLSLLASGFWGKSRHLNYLGEALMGCGIALAAGYPGIPWVWLHPLYLAALLLARQIDDDRACEAKYGELWARYKEKARYRIIPYIY